MAELENVVELGEIGEIGVDVVDRLVGASMKEGVIRGYAEGVSYGYRRGFRNALISAVVGVGLGKFLANRFEKWFDGKVAEAESNGSATLIDFSNLGLGKKEED